MRSMWMLSLFQYSLNFSTTIRSCCTRSTNLYGPAQTGLRPNLSPASLAALGDTIMPARSESCATSGENGALSTSLTVCGSTTSMWSIPANSGLRNEPCMVRWRSSENLTDSASIGSPSWNSTFGRSLMVTILPSSDVSEYNASCGTKLSFSSTSNSLSQIDANTMRPT